ncbi:MAG: CRISPR-associated endoribonuclease Cas6 [Firmicutes bacterium]|nr:CRISPR-associated endoribonuclease Cas6 [Bacillota bacterium]
MRIVFEFTFNGKLVLPIYYNQILQGFIYNNITDKETQKFIHDKGFTYEKRRYKLFTFSRLMGTYRIDNNNKIIKYDSPVTLEVSSHYDDFFIDFSTSIIKNNLVLYDQNIYLENIKVKFPNINPESRIRMLSPIVVYSTDQNKKTYYYGPGDEKFYELVKENLKKKYQAFNGSSIDNINFTIKAFIETQREVTTKYKDFIIKGWMGEYLIKGDTDLITLAYNTGLGGKNSQGFGCFEFIECEDSKRRS